MRRSIVVKKGQQFSKLGARETFCSTIQVAKKRFILYNKGHDPSLAIKGYCGIDNRKRTS